MGYLEFKKQAGWFNDFTDWASDKMLGSYFGKDEYQRRQNVYNDIKNQPKQSQSPYTVNSATPSAVSGIQPPATTGNSNHVIGANAFNNERMNSIQDAATRDAYMDFVLKGGALAQQLQDTNYDPRKLNINSIVSNPNVVSSIGTALENASPASLDSFIRVSEQYQKAMSGKGNTGAVNSGGAGAADSPLTKAKEQLTGSFLKGLWKNVKANPLEMIPQIAGMFLRHIGAGDSIANFASDPTKFYISLAMLLMGGGILLSGGGSQQQPQQIVINNGGQQPDPRMQQVPYSY